MMHWPQTILSILVGACLGAVFFGGLWWTVRRMMDGEVSLWLFGISFLLRSAVVVLGFYLLLRLGSLYLMVGLLAFLAVRISLTSRLGPKSGTGIGGASRSDN